MDALRKGNGKEIELICPVQLSDTPNRIHSFLTGMKGQKEASIIMLASPHEEKIMTTEESFP